MKVTVLIDGEYLSIESSDRLYEPNKLLVVEIDSKQEIYTTMSDRLILRTSEPNAITGEREASFVYITQLAKGDHTIRDCND